MEGVLQYVDGDLELVLEKIIKFEKTVDDLMFKTGILVDINTEIIYSTLESQWIGTVVVGDAKKKKTRKNNKKDIS